MGPAIPPQMQLFASTGHADIAQTSLFLEALRRQRVVARVGREVLFVHAPEAYQRPFQPLGAMDRGDQHAIGGILDRIAQQVDEGLGVVGKLPRLLDQHVQQTHVLLALVPSGRGPSQHLVGFQLIDHVPQQPRGSPVAQRREITQQLPALVQVAALQRLEPFENRVFLARPALAVGQLLTQTLEALARDEGGGLGEQQHQMCRVAQPRGVTRKLQIACQRLHQWQAEHEAIALPETEGNPGLQQLQLHRHRQRPAAHQHGGLGTAAPGVPPGGQRRDQTGGPLPFEQPRRRCAGCSQTQLIRSARIGGDRVIGRQCQTMTMAKGVTEREVQRGRETLGETRQHVIRAGATPLIDALVGVTYRHDFCHGAG